MSTLPDIDNDSLFQFDQFNASQSFLASSSFPLNSETGYRTSPTMSSHDGSPTSEELDLGNGRPTRAATTMAKGKARAIPVPIRTSTITHDLFDVSSPSIYQVIESSSSSPDFDSIYHQHPDFSPESMDSPNADPSSASSYTGKGKQKESYPLLPPLTFSDMELDYDQLVPSTPGPSSYGTLYSPPPLTNSSLPPSSPFSVREISILRPPLSPSPEISHHPLHSPITRCRSLSNLSQQLSPSLGSASTAITQSSFGPAHRSGHISRQLILDNNNTLDASANVVEQTSIVSKGDLQAIEREPGSCPPAWYTVSKSPSPVRCLPPRALLKGKSRSQTSPYPISVLDFVPITSTDIFQPLAIIVPNYFDLVLPKETRIDILRALIDLHEHEHLRLVREGRLTMAKATSPRNRWVGRDKGIRELFKLSRVSKSWQSLVLDGQLWVDLDLRSFPGLPPDLVVRIVQSAGTFIRSLNVAGHVQLLPESITSITNDLCLTIPNLSLPYTQLTTINLQGCIYLTTRSLHHLLVRSKFLRTLSVKGLTSVTNTTCDIISNFCPNLASLNMSRCPNMDAEGIRALAGAANLRKEHLKLTELRLSGLKYVSDRMMRELGRAAPYLEVLDLCYSRQLHNSALEAFVACEEYADHQNLGVETVLVSARDLGREANDSGRLRRRVTRLRHLALSSCVMLTDTACANLAYSMPKLEFLELAGIGPDLKDGGLIRLLSETPYIRRLDLEDANEISNAVLHAITPVVETHPTAATATAQSVPKQPGHVLQQLNISYAANVTDEALLSLIRNCANLRVLEADNTRMGATVLKEFVRLSRQRKVVNGRIVAIDCRGIGESLVKELSPKTRPRLGWRAYDARKLGYLDARDDNEDELKIGQNECDESRVVVKTFFSWQTVDAVKAVREKRRKANANRRTGSNGSSATASDVEAGGSRSTRWWTPGGRRAGGATPGRTSPPILPDLNGEGCRTM